MGVLTKVRIANTFSSNSKKTIVKTGGTNPVFSSWSIRIRPIKYSSRLFSSYMYMEEVQEKKPRVVIFPGLIPYSAPKTIISARLFDSYLYRPIHISSVSSLSLYTYYSENPISVNTISSFNKYITYTTLEFSGAHLVRYEELLISSFCNLQSNSALPVESFSSYLLDSSNSVYSRIGTGISLSLGSHGYYGKSSKSRRLLYSLSSKHGMSLSLINSSSRALANYTSKRFRTLMSATRTSFATLVNYSTLRRRSLSIFTSRSFKMVRCRNSLSSYVPLPKFVSTNRFISYVYTPKIKRRIITFNAKCSDTEYYYSSLGFSGRMVYLLSTNSLFGYMEEEK